MNKITRIAFTAACVLGALVSFFFVLEGHKYVIGEGWAPIHVNIEVDRKFARNVTLFLPQQKELHIPLQTAEFRADGETSEKIIMHTRLTTHGFYRGISLRILNTEAALTLAAIDNISIFIGNKLFYFSSSDIQSWQAESENSENTYLVFPIPGLRYTPSLVIKNWTNYYGDFNLAIMGIFDFLFHPGRYALAYFFIICLLCLYKKYVNAAYRSLRGKSWTRPALFALVILAGFALRVNGFLRASGWLDELYSSVASSPRLPFLRTFSDPGNPPLYYMLLRLAFTLFGWSEPVGKMVSVILGTFSIIAVYVMTLRSGSKKAALLAALFMAVSMYSIGFSREMRSNILRMFLVPLSAAFFLDFQKRPSPANTILYSLSCICLANTHYFGVIFIAANFIYYFCCFFAARKICVRNAVLFVCANAAVALSFLPFFLVTALGQALTDTGFNSSIKAPGVVEFTLLFVIFIFFIAGIFLWKKKTLQALIGENASKFAVYLFSVSALVFTLSQIFSMYRPIFKVDYFLSIVYPLGIVLSALFVLAVSKINYVHARCLAGFCAFLFCVSYYQGMLGGIDNGAFKECTDYIARDSAAHPGMKSATFDGTAHGNYSGYPEYYGHDALPVYSAEGGFDVLYLPHIPFGIHEDVKYNDMTHRGIDYANLLKIHVNDEIVVYKKYLK
ncbi:MAG: glycosyltransferase family 39 protein [Spirochaetaceae bacterium]|jgi:hypothetical protein|nr:glycosyltransferase family 39 protein [Spirochaetaceae bacterium]